MQDSNSDSAPEHLDKLITQMKTDWDWRARENAKWFINTFKLDQSDDEFFETGQFDFKRVVLNDLPLLTANRNPKTLRILEIGCGIGRMTRFFADHFGEVCGIDVSGEMIRLAREHLRGFENVKLFETSGVDFADFKDEYFDLIISLHVFQHAPDKEIVSSSIRDAYRVLNRGGIFKFVTSGITNEEFARAPKNTWEGVGFSGEEVRTLAREIDAQLMSITGEGTQYCWTLLRRPLSRDRSPVNDGRLLRLRFPETGAIEARPEAPQGRCLGLLVDGVSAEDADCNNLEVAVGGRWLHPFYVMPYRQSVQVETLIPDDQPEGETLVRARLSGGEPSNQVSISMPPPGLKVPDIHLVTNVPDGGTDLYARGPKSKIRILVRDLMGPVNPDDLMVLVNGANLETESVEFIPSNAAWLITVQLTDVEAGPAEIQLIHNSNGSAAYQVELLAT